MSLPFPLSPTQTDKFSPVDDNLMDSIRLDLEYLDGLFATGSAIFDFNINGELNTIRGFKKAIDTVALYNAFQPATCRLNLKGSGISGNLKIDLRRHSKPLTPIIGIDHQFEGATQGVANINPALATQSVTRSTAQILTQSITLAKTVLNTQSIINVGGNRWRYNLDAAADADWVVGDYILIAGSTNAANDGTFQIEEVNHSGYPSVVITNASGVAQTAAAGTVTLQLFSYDFINPVDSQFVIGDKVEFAGHTSAFSNGQKTIYKVNQVGNNIWIKDQTGVTQGGVAGTADVLRWKYALSSAAPSPDFTVGEYAEMSGHTNPANDGTLKITALNLTTNNIVVYNESGVVQGGVAGSIGTNRWIYSLPSSPNAQVTAGDTVQLEEHTSSNNDGVFTVKEVSRGGIDNIVIYNESGVSQGSAAGFVRHTRKLVKFSTDQSANYSTLSFVELQNCENALYNFSNYKAQYQVLQVNRGGGSNYNIVIDAPMNPKQLSPAGFVSLEMKSLFTADFNTAASLVGNTPNQFVSSSTTSFVSGLIPAGTPIGLYILEYPGGKATDLTVIVH